jgi:hypothetical protein
MAGLELAERGNRPHDRAQRMASGVSTVQGGLGPSGDVRAHAFVYEQVQSRDGTHRVVGQPGVHGVAVRGGEVVELAFELRRPGRFVAGTEAGVGGRSEVREVAGVTRRLSPRGRLLGRGARRRTR